tara:strand:- start:630 stop:1397 length:768 start_codon:yes stop_codon:yes gene_type:complete
MIFNQLIQTNLRTKELGKKVEYYNRLESTNEEAWELIDYDNQHGTIVITDNQINGKGRKNNSWSMAPGKGLSFSLIIDKEYPSIYSGFISLAAGIAVTESLKKRNVVSYLKWPNDIFALDKKLGGILCESKIIKNQIEKIVIGVGINVNETNSEHPHKIQNNITTMFDITNHAHQRELIVAEFVNCFEHLLIEISTNTNNIIEKWLKHCLHLDSNISFYDNGKIKEGLFVGLDENGFAKIKINEEIQIFNAINLI